jgi:hypothetical protein
MQIYLGKDTTFDDTQQNQPDAVGAKITVPKTENMCSFDVALIQLDTDLTQAGAPIVPLRFTELAANEATVAVGYGVGGNNEDRPARMQRTTTVLGVGPKSIHFATQNGATIDYDIPQGDVATGESTCFGDSGGPLLDSQGRLVAVTSRGTPTPDDGTHGNGCIDAPSIYAGVRFNEQVIRDAAKLAGHELPPDAPAPASTTPAPSPADSDTSDPTSGAATGTSTGGSSPARSSSSASGDDDDDDSSSSSKKKKTAAVPTAQPRLACSSSPGRTGPDSWLPAIAVALALGALRRRGRR